MKKLGLVLVGVLVVLLCVVLYARLFGIEPSMTRPGMWLKGEVVTERIEDWSFARQRPGRVRLETRQWFFPALAHSVTVGRQLYNGRMYINSGYPAGVPLPQGRHWNRNVLANPEVRVGLGDGKLYPAKLVYVTDPKEREECLRAFGPLFWSPGFMLHVWRVESIGAATK